MHLYQFIHSIHWGWAISIVAGFIISRRGEGLAGFRGYSVGRVIGGVFRADTVIPGREGSAGFFGTLLGTALKLAGLVLVSIGIISGVNHFLYG
jgi:hypothetical protein